jgi:hypothetical protein
VTKEEMFDIIKTKIHNLPDELEQYSAENYLREHLTNLPFKFRVNAGLTKAVIIPLDEDYVIKLPLKYRFDIGEYKAENRIWKNKVQQALDEALIEAQKDNPEALLTQEETDFIKASWADSQPQEKNFYYELEAANNYIFDAQEEIDAHADWDYCGLEVCTYKQAVAENLGKYFAEEGFLGVIDNRPVYWQAHCLPFNEIDMDYNSEEYIQKKAVADEFFNETSIYIGNNCWMADFIRAYGKNELIRLNSFIQEYHISDIRNSNIGYLNDMPVLIDYSGCREWD